jgi:hypothetical protein
MNLNYFPSQFPAIVQFLFNFILQRRSKANVRAPLGATLLYIYILFRKNSCTLSPFGGVRDDIIHDMLVSYPLLSDHNHEHASYDHIANACHEVQSGGQGRETKGTKLNL